ncbi:hypothetical protein [Streptomyces avermitilis]|uniref:hypothetical protein n=1 Tax=Streptomyces avermitilis TaxID=33903 RepID=UPI0036794802
MERAWPLVGQAQSGVRGQALVVRGDLRETLDLCLLLGQAGGGGAGVRRGYRVQAGPRRRHCVRADGGRVGQGVAVRTGTRVGAWACTRTGAWAGVWFGAWFGDGLWCGEGICRLPAARRPGARGGERCGVGGAVRDHGDEAFDGRPVIGLLVDRQEGPLPFEGCEQVGQHQGVETETVGQQLLPVQIRLIGNALIRAT